MGEAEKNLIFKTKKYTFRQFTMDNFADFCALNQNAEVMRYVNHNNGKPKTYRECVEKYSDIAYSQDKFGYSYWAVCDGITRDLIGQCGALRTWATDSNTFCYAFKKKYWGKGVGTDVCGTVMSYLFENFPTIDTLTTTAFSENVASVKILKKIGFEYLYTGKEYGRDLEFFEIARSSYVKKGIRAIS
ncbi:MAG: GNAT family N-acetyltransferase [Rickettsiales bacterium]|jgi:ribosomal-protein-alanine N-acetyltransferase|nr:GNAT family N-acetyltransferase [Rickettsiales bacterium]